MKQVHDKIEFINPLNKTGKFTPSLLWDQVWESTHYRVWERIIWSIGERVENRVWRQIFQVEGEGTRI